MPTSNLIIDSATGLVALVKQPWEDKLFDLDFSLDLLNNTITSIDSVTSSIRGNVTGSLDVAIGIPTGVGQTKIQARISGGTDKEDYKITGRLIDSVGNKIEGEGMLYVRDL